MFKSVFADGSQQLCMPSAGPSLLFPSLDLSDLISMEIISLETDSIWEFKKTFKTLFIFTIQLVSMEMGPKRLSVVNS